METRALSERENALVALHWKRYLDATRGPECTLQAAVEAWNAYNKALADNGIVGTLCGYRAIVKPT